jgi:hypothetical protein
MNARAPDPIVNGAVQVIATRQKQSGGCPCLEMGHVRFAQAGRRALCMRVTGVIGLTSRTKHQPCPRHVRASEAGTTSNEPRDRPRAPLRRPGLPC